ncbi:MAG: hypothetical protein KKF33_14140 [Alphaproteobacteria bacterium]|nr:hypothetical protein [Alphaproteobacteria bacterium]
MTQRALAPSEPEGSNMLVLTKKINLWATYSNRLWVECFSKNSDDPSEFSCVEKTLFEVMVLDELKIGEKEFWDEVTAYYILPDNSQKQFCKTQRAGNIYCHARSISISREAKLKIKSIDTAGTMMSGEPYVELYYDDGFILEQIDSLEFELAD